MFKIDPINFSNERSEPLAAYTDVGCSPSRPTIYSNTNHLLARFFMPDPLTRRRRVGLLIRLSQVRAQLGEPIQTRTTQGFQRFALTSSVVSVFSSARQYSKPDSLKSPILRLSETAHPTFSICPNPICEGQTRSHCLLVLAKRAHHG